MAYYKSAHCVIEGAVEIGADASIWHYAVVRGDEDSITIRRAYKCAGRCRAPRRRRLATFHRQRCHHRPSRRRPRLHDRGRRPRRHGRHRHERRKDRQRQHHRSWRRRSRRHGDPTRFPRYRRASKNTRQRPSGTASGDSGKRPALRQPCRKAPGTGGVRMFIYTKTGLIYFVCVKQNISSRFYCL